MFVLKVGMQLFNMQQQYSDLVAVVIAGKKLFTRSDAKLASQREPQIAEWLQKLVQLPERVRPGICVIL